MTFYKPKELTYTQIAQWVDSNHMSTDCDENKLCEYIYHLVVLKTQQCCYFKESEQIDDFSLYCTSKLLQKIYSCREKQESLKSIVNYIRTVISPWKAEYIREFCTGSAESNIADFDLSDFSDYLIDTASQCDYNSYWFECINVSDVIRKYLKQIPRKKNSAEWSNIYTSCLLTLQDRIKTASSAKKTSDTNDPKVIDRIIRNIKKRPPILYHIEDSKANYITTLVNELTHALASEISHTTASKVSVSACMRNLVTAASNSEEEN